ncbi:hypothetical protein EGW08_012757 [Elysia chlorotica]|uniref:C3HC-type domain-containing protein n=1 Tax=Elysia chlorotica TaxID=188477 RepID=A0A433TD18_ELYCH|nr:hypothetical protein EGW08_012757 [Elysia chlorotica]
MGSPITPERIKGVLSSFLVKTEEQKSKQVGVDKSGADTNVQKDTPRAETVLSPKSNTAVLRSHNSFLKRLDTFSALTWFGKPAELSPLICARYGWENIEADMLQCTGCKTFLCGKLPPKTDIEEYNKTLEKLKKCLVTSHDRFCVLGCFPCPEEFCHVQVDDVLSLSTSFIERVSALGEIQDHLPRLDFAYLEDLGYDEGQAGAYCKRNLVTDKDISPAAVTLAFTGWACSSTNKEVLMCSMCRRKIGLWNFTPLGAGQRCDRGESSSEEGEEDSEPRVKRRKFASSTNKATLNPVDEHSHWCPWIREVLVSTKSLSSANLFPSSSPEPASSKSIPVFIAALKSIAPGLMDNNTGLAAGMKKSPMTEGLRCFRRALHTWSSPKTNTETGSPQQAQRIPAKTS